jgi:hypothetical protein
MISNIELVDVNIDIANASRQLAEATNQDGSAMKTIAVMTMAILPVTFFAALFSVPSLQWDKPGVIGNNFGHIGLSRYLLLLSCSLSGSWSRNGT